MRKSLSESLRPEPFDRMAAARASIMNTPACSANAVVTMSPRKKRETFHSWSSAAAAVSGDTIPVSSIARAPRNATRAADRRAGRAKIPRSVAAKIPSPRTTCIDPPDTRSKSHHVTDLWTESGEDEQCRAECLVRRRSSLVQGCRKARERGARIRC